MQENPYAAPEVDATVAPELSGGTVRPRDWTVSHVLGVGWKAIKDQPVPLVGGMLLVTVVQWAAQSLMQFVLLGDAIESADMVRIFSGMGIMFPVLTVIGVYFMIGQIRVALAAARGKPVEIGMYFSGYDKLLPGIVTSLLVSVGVTFGLMLLVIPGILLGLGWALSFFALVDTDASPTEAMSASWEQTKGHRGKIFLFYLACLGVVLVGMLALYVGIFVAIPLILVASAEMYLCVSGRA
jgi:hypothetical protein